MAKVGNTIATLLIGAAVGVAVGYVLATDKETRTEDLEKVLAGHLVRHHELLEVRVTLLRIDHRAQVWQCRLNGHGH